MFQYKNTSWNFSENNLKIIKSEQKIPTILEYFIRASNVDRYKDRNEFLPWDRFIPAK